jgi:hypothetical protein
MGFAPNGTSGGFLLLGTEGFMTVISEPPAAQG